MKSNRFREYVRSFLRGMGDVLAVGGGEIHVRRHGSAWEALESDWRAVGNDIRGVMYDAETLPGLHTPVESERDREELTVAA